MELQDADWPAVCVLKTTIAAAAILKNVPIRNGAKIEAKGISSCFQCQNDCRKGLLSKIKPYGFTLFAKRYGLKILMDCLERNEKNGIVYHRQGIRGDYDDFNDVEELIAFIKNGRRT